MIEKDFWVTVLLKYLFEVSPWRSNLLFKGGTCLSKCYHAIERFSEDIDLVIDWRLLGYGNEGPEIRCSKKQMDKMNDELVRRSVSFLEEEFVPEMKKGLSEILSCGFEITHIKEGVIFRYPVLYGTSSVKSEILLEISPRGTWKDSRTMGVKSYVSEVSSDLCDESIAVLCTSLERAFCKKVLIVHTTAAKNHMSDRYSRHYYDVCSIVNRIDLSAIGNIIEDTVQFKKRFFPGNNCGYGTMVRGVFSLALPDEIRGEFGKDYRAMEEMIFGNVPSIEEIEDVLRKIENELNC